VSRLWSARHGAGADSELRISIFADDGGAINPSHTGSPGSRLAATVPSTA
jgi:hypothetical protein